MNALKLLQMQSQNFFLNALDNFLNIVKILAKIDFSTYSFITKIYKKKDCKQVIKQMKN